MRRQPGVAPYPQRAYLRPMLFRLLCRACGFVCFTALWPGTAVAQYVVPQRGEVASQVESDTVSGFWLAAMVSASPYVAGGGFQGFGTGGGVGAIFTADLGSDLAIDLKAVGARFGDEGLDDHASMFDLGIQVRWRVEGIPGDLRFGPLLGFTWLRTGDGAGTRRGFHAGAALGVRIPLAHRWAWVVQGQALWSGFDAPRIPGLPPESSQRVFGRRGTLEIGVARRLGG